jgi:hypothetical protein
MAQARTPSVKWRASRRKKPKAVARILRPVLGEGVPLEDVLVAFEKSLARATQHSVETSRAEVGFGLGERAIYVVDALNLQLKVGLNAALGPEGKLSHMLVDFSERERDTHSTLEFRVQARPLEMLKGSQLILADLDSMGRLRPVYRLRGTLLLPAPPPVEQLPRALPGAGEAETLEIRSIPTEGPEERRLHPQAGLPVEVRIIGGDSNKSDSFTAVTNAVGQFEFTLDAADNSVTCGNKQGRLAGVDLKEKDDDFFVFALHTPGGGAAPIVSNVLHLDVKRAPQ